MYDENVDCWIKPFKPRKIQFFDLNQQAGLKEFRDIQYKNEYSIIFRTSTMKWHLPDMN